MSLDQLPLEIVLDIFRFIDVPDILRIRRVSRYLNKVSHRRDVWFEAYRRADCIRPPGPFLSQSARHLEDTLVSGFLVHSNLRKNSVAKQREMQTLKRSEIRYTGVDPDVSLIYGRFLLTARNDEVRCYDLSPDVFDGTSIGSVIYRARGGTSLKSFRCASAIDLEGCPIACMVLSEAAQVGRRTQVSIYSLNIVEQSKVILDLLHQFEFSQFNLQSVVLGPRVILVSGILGIGHLDDDFIWHVVALDVHTRTQFLLSSFNPGWNPDKTAESFSLISISTSTHLVLARSRYSTAEMWHTFFQAFTLPPVNVHERSISLDHSHSGMITDMDIKDVVLLRDAVLDTSTRDILITIAFEHCLVEGSKYCTLRLGRPDCDGTITSQSFGSFGRHYSNKLFRPSFDGTGRVFYNPEPGLYGIMEYDVRSNGGSDCEPGIIMREYPSVIRSHTLGKLLDYDPYSGRICLRSRLQQYRVMEIVELAV